MSIYRVRLRMNNYDDIKRFKDKLNLEGIDYKEIVENRPNNTANNWAIIKQVATADEPFHPLEHGHSTQPTPAPVSHQEFSAASAVQPARQSASHNNQGQGILHALDETSAPAQEPTFASPLLSALSKVMPLAAGAVSGIAAETRSALDHGAAAHNPFAARPAGATAPGGLGGATLFTTASRQDFAP